MEFQYTENNIVRKAWSDLTDMPRDVPQGSILGPILFLLLTNDFPKVLNEVCHSVMYADDTVVTSSSKTMGHLADNNNAILCIS